jgi:hypothetical protein
LLSDIPAGYRKTVNIFLQCVLAHSIHCIKLEARQSHERSINQLQRLQDIWDGFVLSKGLTGVSHLWKVNIKIGLILEDDFTRMDKSQKMTYREWPNLGRGFDETSWLKPS